MIRLFKNFADKAVRLFGKMKSKFDKNGSYTGTAEGENEKPEQDADDL